MFELMYFYTILLLLLHLTLRYRILTFELMQCYTIIAILYSYYYYIILNIRYRILAFQLMHNFYFLSSQTEHAGVAVTLCSCIQTHPVRI
jgi:hypothetical protein